MGLGFRGEKPMSVSSEDGGLSLLGTVMPVKVFKCMFYATTTKCWRKFLSVKSLLSRALLATGKVLSRFCFSILPGNLTAFTLV